MQLSHRCSLLSSLFDLDFQSQMRSIKRNMELIEDIPTQYKIGNLGGDHFDSILLPHSLRMVADSLHCL